MNDVNGCRGGIGRGIGRGGRERGRWCARDGCLKEDEGAKQKQTPAGQARGAQDSRRIEKEVSRPPSCMRLSESRPAVNEKKFNLLGDYKP